MRRFSDLSRITKLILMTLAGLCIFVPLAMRGYGRLGAIFFLAWVIAEIAIFSSMKPVPADFAHVRKLGQVKTARRLQWMGYVYVAGLVIALCSTDYRHVYWAGTLTEIAVSVALIWFLFRSAKRIRNTPPEEWDRRVHK